MGSFCSKSRDINEVSQEEKMMDAPVTMLSANASPFHPAYEHVNIAIFNDGVPSLSMTSEKDCMKILHGIQDEALDDEFPPDAQEAAELESVENFVRCMAELALMEEREERARGSFDHIKKRFEVRREEGLIGRPKPAKHSIEPVQHLPPAAKTTSLVPHAHSHRLLLTEDRLRAQSARRSEPRYKKAQRPIHIRYSFGHQPRKQN